MEAPSIRVQTPRPANDQTPEEFLEWAREALLRMIAVNEPLFTHADPAVREKAHAAALITTQMLQELGELDRVLGQESSNGAKP